MYVAPPMNSTGLPLDPSAPPRRPLRTRTRGWARGLSSRLAGWGVRPNAVSLMSIVASLVACAAFAGSAGAPRSLRAACLLLAALFIQLRLLANMLDGLIAVESGRHTPTGDLFNEIPDRVDDLLILVGAGFAVANPLSIGLGLACAIFAILTAYIRVLAGSLGLPQRFTGPMAKPHRMATLTVAALMGSAEVVVTGGAAWSIQIGLGIIALGSVVTVMRRIRLAAQDLRSA